MEASAKARLLRDAVMAPTEMTAFHPKRTLVTEHLPPASAAPICAAMAIQIRTSLAEPETGESFVPHRPARPDKAEGGKRVRAEVRLSAGRRPADRDQGAGRGHQRQWRGQPGAARRHRLGQDLHHGQGDRADPAAGAGARARTRSSPPSSTASSRASSPTMRSNISSATTTITSPRPMSRGPTPTSRRKAR